ncbi:MAG: hypothetical protein A2X35_00260 [Elusimicrobia bacterium GWA2_61_42]|nr:MAG: hypothetical protein A2X35_00260 [Elusimicrobia bacterium GWA2_61_42]OGR74528.1 MAG: hypothetical protein A2X38_08010 [Elusimicrobia bacterium GWC2_61_25]
MLKKYPFRYLQLLALLILPITVNAAAPEDNSASAASVFVYGLPARTELPVSLLPISPAVTAEKAASAGHYLAMAGLDLRAVPAAPADGSAQDKEDFRIIFDWQARRTTDQCARAKAEMSHSYEVFFGKLGLFAAPTPASVTGFFRNVGEDSVAAHKYLKDVYKRPRPFVRDAAVKPCLPQVQGFAYPSGHSTMARLFALILADLVPARRAELLARADEAGLFRVIGGVHHPSDIAAGKALAEVLYKNLLKDPQFAADLRALRPLLK